MRLWAAAALACVLASCGGSDSQQQIQDAVMGENVPAHTLVPGTMIPIDKWRAQNAPKGQLFGSGVVLQDVVDGVDRGGIVLPRFTVLCGPWTGNDSDAPAIAVAVLDDARAIRFPTNSFSHQLTSWYGEAVAVKVVENLQMPFSDRATPVPFDPKAGVPALPEDVVNARGAKCIDVATQQR